MSKPTKNRQKPKVERVMRMLDLESQGKYVRPEHKRIRTYKLEEHVDECHLL